MTRFGVHHDAGDAFGLLLAHRLFECLFEDELNFGVDRESDVGALCCRKIVTKRAADFFALQVALRERIAVDAFEIAFMLRLDSALPNVIHADKAEHLRQQIAIGVIPAHTFGKIDAWQIFLIDAFGKLWRNLQLDQNLGDIFFDGFFIDAEIA